MSMIRGKVRPERGLYVGHLEVNDPIWRNVRKEGDGWVGDCAETGKKVALEVKSWSELLQELGINER